MVGPSWDGDGLWRNLAAKAIRMTGRPVGLVVWRGAHSWVMSGFTATADPASADDFEVHKVFVQDPWFPS